MKIPLKNQILEIGFYAFKKPNLTKLEKELRDFFSKNEVEGYEIKQFRIETGFTGKDYDIVPIEPPLEECLSGEGLHVRGLEEIGKKYGIRSLDFAPFCYHK